MQRSIFRAVLAVAITAAIVAAALFRDQLSVDRLDAWIANLGLWAPLAFLALYAAGTVIFMPGLLFALAGGALFGPVWGSVLNLLGATLGASIAFLIARYLAGDWVQRRSGGFLKRLMDGVESEDWRFVAFLRLVPLFPFNLTNYALGLTRISFASYVITSLLCMIPGAVAYTWLGHASRGAISGDASAIRYGLLAVGLLAIIALAPRLVKAFRKPHTFGWTTAEDLQRTLETAQPLTILDVRSADEFVGDLGHIPGAVNIPLNLLQVKLAELRQGPLLPIVVVCQTDKRSAAAADSLSRAGFTRVDVLRGGMKQWNSLGYFVDRNAEGVSTR